MVSLAATVEAILYLKAKPLKIAEIAEFAHSDRDHVEDALIQLMEDYAHRDSALEVVESDDGYSLQLRSGFQSLVQVLVPVDLGVGALRTLAAIALRPGLTQTELVELRGSGAYQHVQELVDQGFVRKRRLKEGRSSQLSVTEKFHQYFQIDQLPILLQGTPPDSGSAEPPLTDPTVAEPDLAEPPLAESPLAESPLAE